MHMAIHQNHEREIGNQHHNAILSIECKVVTPGARISSVDSGEGFTYAVQLLQSTSTDRFNLT
jgi:hypothetical protein